MFKAHLVAFSFSPIQIPPPQTALSKAAKCTAFTGPWHAMGQWWTAGRVVPLWSSRGSCCCQDRYSVGCSPSDCTREKLCNQWNCLSEWRNPKTSHEISRNSLASSTYATQSLFSTYLWAESRRRRTVVKRNTSHWMRVCTLCLQCHKLCVEVRWLTQGCLLTATWKLNGYDRSKNAWMRQNNGQYAWYLQRFPVVKV